MATASIYCQWCSQPLTGNQLLLNCINHNICNKCKINKRTCQSACPLCWYINGTVYLSENNICAVCYKNIQNNDSIRNCDNQHKYCSNCSQSGCLLCNLNRLRSWGHCSLDELPGDAHRIIEICDALEKKFEENSSLNRCDSTDMDVDYNPTSIDSKLTVQNNDCRICLDDLDATQYILPVCKHIFHRNCIEKWFQSNGKQTCPTCGYLYGITKGPQPQGEMKIKYIQTPLPGFPSQQYPSNEGPTIEINYTIPSGIQGPLNPQPGQPFTGTNRTAYLPNNPEGKYILNLLQRAFNDQHIFTIGKSTTTGRDNVVIWNDIHHKTQINGGPEQYGYPDPTYLKRVYQELADKGYK